MIYDVFFTKNTLSKAVAGAVLTLFALTSILAPFPVQFAQAAEITGLTATAHAEDSSKTTLGVGDQLIVSLNYQSSLHELAVNGTCTINNKDVASSFQSFQDGTFQLVYTVAEGDASAAAGQIPINCALIDAGGDTTTLTSFTSPHNVAVQAAGVIDGGGNTGGGDTGGGDTGGNTGGGDTGGNTGGGDTGGNTGGGDTGGNTGGDGELPPAGTFTVTAEPNTGTLNPGDQLIVRINDRGGVVDFAVDPAGDCTINGKDVSSSFQAFGDHTYQLVYNVAQGDASVAAGQLAISCELQNPEELIASIIDFTDSNTIAISGGGSTGGGDTTGGGTNGGNTNATTTDNTNTGTTTTNTGTTTNNTGTTTDNTNTGGNTGGNNTSTTTPSTTDGEIDGNVDGGLSAQNGVLAVTSINQVRGTAVADGTLENGWKWIFRVTVPTNETKLQMKFGNWMHSNNTNWISPANNMRISSAQAVGGAQNYVMVDVPDTYTTALDITGDLDTSVPGRQIEVVVEMGVPVGSLNGSYSTNYFVKTNQ